MRTSANSGRRTRGAGRSRISGLPSVLVLAWFVIGAVSAGQRDYFDSAPTNCSNTGTIAVTVLAGPLNYLGMNPKVGDCRVDVPQPRP